MRIAEARTNKIIEMLRLLGNCSNRSVYEYDDNDVEKIFSAIEKEIRSAKSRLLGHEEDEDKFRLHD